MARMWTGLTLAAAALLSGCSSMLEMTDPNPPAYLERGQVPAFQAPPARTGALEDCPEIDIPPGGAALRAGTNPADPAAVRNQITIANVARECQGQADGSVLVKVGVEGRVLLGPGGAPGRYDAPVRVVVKRNDRVFATRLTRVPVTVPSGDTQGSFTMVEDGLIVPPGNGSDFEIEVSLGGQGAAPARRRRG